MFFSLLRRLKERNSSEEDPNTEGTPSELNRREGNRHFQSAIQDTQAQVSQLYHLEKAAICFREARSLAETSDERASAWKNLGSTLVRRLELILTREEFCIDENFEVCVLECCASIEQALIEGKAARKTTMWMSQVRASLKKCLDNVSQAFDKQRELPDVQRRFLEDLVTPRRRRRMLHPTPHSLLAWAALQLASSLFKEALKCIEANNTLQALPILQEARGPWESCASAISADLAGKLVGEIFHPNPHEFVSQTSQNVSIRTCTEAFLKNLVFTTFSMEAEQEIRYAERHNTSAIMNAEDLDMDRLTLAFDCLRQAAVLARKANDLRTEAKALAQLGSIYYNVLKMDKVARPLLETAVRIALSLPGNPTQTIEWYMPTAEALQAIRDKTPEENQENQTEDDPEILKERKKLESYTSAAQLIEYILEKHPPKSTTKIPEGPFGGEELGKQILKVLRCYHVDKNRIYGEKWKRLCEEITKRLNHFYNVVK